MDIDEILAALEAAADAGNVAGMARYGITASHIYGVKIPVLRKLAKEARSRDAARNHAMAAELWAVDSRETRILATMIDAAKLVTEQQMESWAADFDSWEVCDQCIQNLFEDVRWAYDKATAWSERQEEFVKRAGFVLMARLAVSDKSAADARFRPFFGFIEREADDGRNFVKKAVNWALRQIGKRNLTLNGEALAVARRLAQRPKGSATWIAGDAIKELESAAVQDRLRAKAAR